MKKIFCLLTVGVFACGVHAQGIVVNSDGTHSVIMGNVVVGPDGKHSVIMGNVIVNPDGTHTHIIGNDSDKGESGSAVADSIRVARIERKIEKKAAKRSERETKRDIRRQGRKGN